MKDEIEEKLRKLAAVAPGEAEVAWRLYLASEAEERQEVEQFVDALLFLRIGKDYRERVRLDPPFSDDCAGSYVLGSVTYPEGAKRYQFGLREEEWIRHVMICGMSGTGKTNLVFKILDELVSHRKRFMLFDWKQNYRDLLQLPQFGHVQVVTVGRNVAPLEFNPLLPPTSVAPGQWLMKLVDVIKHAYFVGEGVEYLLREAIDWVYEKCGFLDGTRAETPTFIRVRDYVYKKHVQGRMMLWKASALRVLESLCFRHGLGPVVNCHGQTDESLLTADVVLELDALSDSDKTFLTEAMILWIYELRKNEGKREEFKHALVVEEAHHILSHQKENVEGAETIMETCLRQIREFGEAVIVVDQEPTKLSNSIKANTYTKITFNLGNGKDVEEIARCMGLDAEESEYIGWLPVGEAIVTLNGRTRSPLHVAFPRMAVTKGAIRDEGLRLRQSASLH